MCSQNRLRSPTAARVFSQWPGVKAKSAGLDKDAAIPLSPGLIAWADIILVMEQAHRKKLRKRFRAYLAEKPVIVLDVPDEYVFAGAAPEKPRPLACRPLNLKHLA